MPCDGIDLGCEHSRVELASLELTVPYECTKYGLTCAAETGNDNIQVLFSQTFVVKTDRVVDRIFECEQPGRQRMRVKRIDVCIAVPVLQCLHLTDVGDVGRIDGEREIFSRDLGFLQAFEKFCRILPVQIFFA